MSSSDECSEVDNLLDFASGRVYCGMCHRKHDTKGKSWRKCANHSASIADSVVFYNTKHLKFDPNFQLRGIHVRFDSVIANTFTVELYLGINQRLASQLGNTGDEALVKLSRQMPVKNVKSVSTRVALPKRAEDFGEWLTKEVVPAMFTESRAQVDATENRARDALDAFVTKRITGWR